MKQSDAAEFQSLLSSVLGFYSAPPTTFARSVWWEACQPFELAEVRRAFTAHATDPDRGMFAPKPADVVRQLSGTATDRAAQAWRKTLAAAGQIGAYSDVVFDDPLIHACVDDLGGWPKVCRTEQESLGYVHHRFLETYKALAARGASDYPRKLLGDRGSDDLYRKRGIDPPKPALVGDREMALMVLEGGAEPKRQEVCSAISALIPVRRIS